MSLYDFYMYLKYIEFSAENLEFYVWCVSVRTRQRLSTAARRQTFARLVSPSVEPPADQKCALRYKNYEATDTKTGSSSDKDDGCSTSESTSSAEDKEKTAVSDLPFVSDPEIGK